MYYNIKDQPYGAAGDGTVDDTPAFQAALDDAYSAGGGTVLIPPGSYRFDSIPRIRSNTKVSAYGAYIFANNVPHKLLANFDQNVDSFLGFNGYSHITIEGGIWDGRGHLAGQDKISNIMSFIHCHDITVRDVILRNTAWGHALELSACYGALVENCRFEGFKDTTVDGSRNFSEALELDLTKVGSSTLGEWDEIPCYNVTIIGCTMDESDDAGPFGCLIGAHSIVSGKYYDGIRIIGNICERSLQHGIRAKGFRDPVIQGNQIRNVGGRGIWVYDGLNGVIVGNTVRDTGAGHGGIYVCNQNGMAISGNSVINADGYAIHLKDCVDNLVEGNHIWGSTLSAFKLDDGCNRCLLTNNMVRQGDGGSVAVVNASGSGNTNDFIHNRLTGYGSGSGVIDSSTGTLRTTLSSNGSIGQNFS